VLLHDAPDDGKAQSQTGAPFFGSKQGLKDMFQMRRRDAHPGVLEGNFQVFALAGGSDVQRAAFRHGLIGVRDEIAKCLLELLAVDPDVRQLLCARAYYLNPRRYFHTGQCLIQQALNVHFGQGRLMHSGEIHQVGDDLVRGPDLLFQDT